MSNIIEELKTRKILDNITNQEKFDSLPKGAGVYIGFDPTGSSLHLGNYIQISILKKFEAAGYAPIAVIGGATGMIGDPSGKSKERNLLDDEELNNNKSAITNQLKSFGLNVVDNYDFYKDMNVLDFMRNVGKLLNVNYMISKDVVKSRLETGISFTEFSYQLIQGWDFKKLYENNNVFIQVGGSDQWGNITSGIEIIRKTIGDKNKAIGITTKLLTSSTGKKFGKSEKGAIFLDKKMTSPYEMYQFLLNTTDDDVEQLLLWITSLSIDEVKTIIADHKGQEYKKIAQKALAKEVVIDIHGSEAFEETELITSILFGGMSINGLTLKQVEPLMTTLINTTVSSKNIVDVLVGVGAATSKRQAREFIENNSVEINGNKETNANTDIDFAKFNGKAIIKRGKRNFYIASSK